jgi:hypothetical protein
MTFVSSAEADVAAVATEVSACRGFIKLAVEVVVATALPAPLNKRSRIAYPELVAAALPANAITFVSVIAEAVTPLV